MKKPVVNYITAGFFVEIGYLIYVHLPFTKGFHVLKVGSSKNSLDQRFLFGCSLH